MAIDRNITVDFELHERQRRIWNDPARFRVVARPSRRGTLAVRCCWGRWRLQRLRLKRLPLQRN